MRFILGESHSRLYPHMRAKFGRDPTAGSKKVSFKFIIGYNISNLYLYNTNSVCLSVCLSSIGGQTAGPIMTTFGTHMRIDLGMVPTKYWPHEWPGSVGSLGPISESGLSCQLLLRAVVWQMTSQ